LVVEIGAGRGALTESLLERADPTSIATAVLELHW
jgi:16S rRNA A1518/A1519 N6-dimethyltransferase RsmA/KsgA/DIM1 with predicted DNA glycosylase/AP lyase activity